MQYDHERFLKFLRVSRNNGCWYYCGDKNPEGYGRFYFTKPKKTYQLAHRISYELFVGRLTKELVIDHKCRNRACCNPDHLRQVDRRTNVLENSDALAFHNSLKTYCKFGHELSGDNVLLDRKNAKSKQGILWKRCKVCVTRIKQEWYQRNKEALKVKAILDKEKTNENRRKRYQLKRSSIKIK